MSDCRYYIGTFRLKHDESSDIWHDQIMRDQMGPILDDAFKYGAKITEERSIPSDFDILHCHLYAKFKNDKQAMLFVLKYPQARLTDKIRKEDYAKNLNWIG